MISIIIPVYNAEKYIIECLNSIKQQNVTVEVICVDDGSTDNSGYIIKQYSYNNPFVKYIFQENAGAPAARNRGFEVATGEYCMFFDADDILLPDGLTTMLLVIERTGSDIVIGDYFEIDERGNKRDCIKQKQFVKDASNHWSFSICPPLPGNKLLKKSILDNSSIKFENVEIGQDLNFYLKLLTITKKITLVNQNVMGYRIVDGSISRQYTLKILDICNSIDDVKKFYQEKGYLAEYQKYVSIVELIAYRSQLEKIKYFSNKNDIERVRSTFYKRIKQCKKLATKITLLFFKEWLKCLFILCKYN